jgi:hypothetical protein
MKIKALFLGLFLCLNIHAQEEDVSLKDSLWTIGGEFNLNFQNVGLYNWAAGGQSAFAFSAFFVGHANFDDGKHKWTNDLNTGFGMLNQKSNRYPTRKTDDQLILNSQYGKYLNKHWLLSAGLRFQTQYTTGNEFVPDENGIEQRNKISGFMSPGYLTPSLGIEYSIKDVFTTSFSPVAARFIFVNDEELSSIGAFGVDPGKKNNIYFGFNYYMWFKKELFENVTFENTLNVFGPYEKLSQMKVNWETSILMTVNDWLNFNVGTNLIYDHDVKLLKENGSFGPGTQFKYALSLGLTFKFGEEK